MSRFNVHEWNYKRRLEEASDLDRFSAGAIAADQVEKDRINKGQSPERQQQALDDLQMAIEELEMSGVFDTGNSIVQTMLNKAYKMLAKTILK